MSGLFGGGGGSSSSSQTTNNSDKRISIRDGTAVSGDGSTVNITDGGIVSRALDTVDVANATNAEGFDKLLAASQNLFNNSTKAVAGAYETALTEKAGTGIDNKTMIVLAVAGAAALVLARRG